MNRLRRWLAILLARLGLPACSWLGHPYQEIRKLLDSRGREIGRIVKGNLYLQRPMQNKGGRAVECWLCPACGDETYSRIEAMGGRVEDWT